MRAPSKPFVALPPIMASCFRGPTLPPAIMKKGVILGDSLAGIKFYELFHTCV
jgi:hypothetical protein